MKKLLIAFTLLACVCTKSSFANDGTISPEVLKSFQNKFTTAKDAFWTVTEDLYKVRFSMDGQSITAFYNADGSLAAATRNISSFQLPVSLQAEIKNEHKEYWITHLFELSNDEGVYYYITLEDANTKVVLKSDGSSWNQFQKQRKG